MLWSKPAIEELQRHVRAAIATVREHFEDAQHLISADKAVWGQFLNDSRDNTQYGIYGTSSALQLLSLAGRGANDPLIQRAAAALDWMTEPDLQEAHFVTKGDLTVVYKLAFLINAWKPWESRLDEANVAAATTLIGHVIPEQGWGDYFSSEQERDLNPSLLATTVALLALRRHRSFRSSDACEDSLRWLCNRVLEAGGLSPSENGMVVLALNSYASEGVRVQNYRQALAEATKNLSDWAIRSDSLQYGVLDHHHFPAAHEGVASNRYLFLLPHCIAAFAFLTAASTPEKMRSYVLDVADFYSREIKEKGMFRPSNTHRASTVDHLWIATLFAELVGREATALAPRYSRVLARMTLPAQVCFWLVLLVAGAWGLYQAWIGAQANEPNISQIVGGSLLATLALGFLRALVHDKFFKAES